jgi:hypothetical protein
VNTPHTSYSHYRARVVTVVVVVVLLVMMVVMMMVVVMMVARRPVPLRRLTSDKSHGPAPRQAAVLVDPAAR